MEATPRPQARPKAGRPLAAARAGGQRLRGFPAVPAAPPDAHRPAPAGQPAASPAPVESAPDSGTPGISVNWEPSPSPAPEEQEEAPWYLRLVNLENRLPQDFTVELAQVDGGQFDARAAEALSQMLADMEAQGLSPMVCSSFRTWEDQETLHRIKSAACWRRATPKRRRKRRPPGGVVPAGASEHQLGLAPRTSWPPSIKSWRRSRRTPPSSSG